MIQYQDAPAPPPPPAAGWPGQAAFEADPHVRVNGRLYRCQDFFQANFDLLDREGVQDILDDLKAKGHSRYGEFVITACGRPGAGMSAAMDRLERRDTLLRDLLDLGLSTVSLTVAGTLSAKITPDRSGLLARHCPRPAVR